jgi:hypothetical protein
MTENDFRPWTSPVRSRSPALFFSYIYDFWLRNDARKLPLNGVEMGQPIGIFTRIKMMLLIECQLGMMSFKAN